MKMTHTIIRGLALAFLHVFAAAAAYGILEDLLKRSSSARLFAVKSIQSQPVHDQN